MRTWWMVLAMACGGGAAVDEASDDTALGDDTAGDDTPLLPLDDRVDAAAAFGPHTVGFQLTSLTYASPFDGSDRTLKLSLWYPTPATDGPEAGFTGPHAPQGVIDGAALADGPFPVLLFSHGHQGNMDNCALLMAHLASHGWIVAAPEHTGNTLADGDSRTAAIFLERPFDVSATLDHLEADATFGPALSGDVAALGHSFGGYTTFLLAGAGWAVDAWDAACDGGSDDPICTGWDAAYATKLREGAADDRIAAAASLSGGNHGHLGDTGIAGIDRPFLLVSGALDSAVSNEANSDPIWASLPPGDKVRVDLAHGDHQTYTDFAEVFAGILSGTSADALEADRGHRIQEVYLTAFLATHVLGERGWDAVLDGTYEVDADVTVSTKP